MVQSRKPIDLVTPYRPLKMKPETTCDTMHLTYRLDYMIDRNPVEVALRYQIKRCSLEYTLGDLLYSTTLLP